MNEYQNALTALMTAHWTAYWTEDGRRDLQHSKEELAATLAETPKTVAEYGPATVATLTGTEKQIAYASALRNAEICEHLDAIRNVLRTKHPKKMARLQERNVAPIVELASATNASALIDQLAPKSNFMEKFA